MYTTNTAVLILFFTFTHWLLAGSKSYLEWFFLYLILLNSTIALVQLSMGCWTLFMEDSSLTSTKKLNQRVYHKKQYITDKHGNTMVLKESWKHMIKGVKMKLYEIAWKYKYGTKFWKSIDDFLQNKTKHYKLPF